MVQTRRSCPVPVRLIRSPTSWLSGLFALALLLGATPASADLILTLSDPTAPIYVGGTFTVDLFASGSNLNLSDFAVEFQIGQPGSPDTPVLPTPTFADGTMANPNPTATLGNYVFSGQSADALTPTTFGSAVADSHGQLTTFEGGDNQQNPSDPNDSFNDVNVTSTNGLLAQLTITAPSTIQDLVMGDTYQLSLDSLGINTIFDNSSGSLTIDPSSKLSTTFTILVAPSAVPEPSSFLLCMTTLAAGLLYLGSRRFASSRTKAFAS